MSWNFGKKNLSKLLRDSKMTMFFLMASRRPWEDTCKSLDQNSKTVPRRPTRKGRNQCIIPFDLSDWREKLDFFSKDLGTFFGLGLAIWPDLFFCLIDPTLIFRVLTPIFGSRVKVGLKFLGPNKFRVRVRLKPTRPYSNYIVSF